MANPIAPANKVWDDFLADVNKGFIEDTFTVHNHKFVMRTPSEDDEIWASTFVKANTPAAYQASRRVPALAIAIKSIDGVVTDKMFSYPDDMQENERKVYDTDTVQRHYWVCTQLMYKLAQLPPPVVGELFVKYEDLVRRRNEALTEGIKQTKNA